MEEELKIFVRKSEKIYMIILFLKLVGTHTKRLDHLETKLKEMTLSVANKKSLNAGGKFEWVDSVLIKVNFGQLFNFFENNKALLINHFLFPSTAFGLRILLLRH